MLISLKEAMNYAEERSCAVGAFDTMGLAQINSVLRAAEDVGEPVIMMPQFAVYPIEHIAPAAIELAKRAKVPVCVHLDHAKDFGLIMKALQLGYTSVMIDASELPYEQNIAKSAEIVNICKHMGVTVEAELGQMTRSESGEELRKESLYTDPEQARDFIERTGVDALAIAFGTVHGIYTTTPVLDVSIVKKVRDATNNFPLVMHGGSGLSKDEYAQVIQNGIRKINYFSYMNRAGGEGARALVSSKASGESTYYTETEKASYEAMYENIYSAIKLFSGKE